MFDNEFISIKPLGKGMMYAQYKKGVIINLETAKRIVEERLKFQGGIDYYYLIDVSEVMFITKKAKKYFRLYGEQGVKSYAVIMNTNKVHRLLLNAYAKIVNTPIRFRMFLDYEPALAWLNQQVTAAQDAECIASGSHV